MECRHTLFTDFLMFKNSWTSERLAFPFRRWSVILLVTGSFLSIPTVFGQGFTSPMYTPNVSDAYFFGNSNDVYPAPYQSQQQEYIHFEVAPGVSNPVPNQEVRARNRSERRERIRKIIGSDSSSDETFSRTQSERAQNLSQVHWEITYPESAPAPNGQRSTSPVAHALRSSNDNSSWKTPAPTLWDNDGTTSALPIPEEKVRNQSIIHDESVSDLILEPIPETEKKDEIQKERHTGPQSILIPIPAEVAPQNHKTSAIYHDSIVQQVVFFTKSAPETNEKAISSTPQPQSGRRLSYPKRRQATTPTDSNETLHFPQSFKNDDKPHLNSAWVQTVDMTVNNAPLSKRYSQMEFQLPESKEPMFPAHSANQNLTSEFTQTNTGARSILQNPNPVVHENSTENLVYEPAFPEKTMKREPLMQVLPERNVFQDFGLRKTINRNSLPWYSIYIQDLNINEERLFNTLRLQDDTKLSQSRSPFSLIEAGILASHPKDAAEANHLVNIYDNIEYYVLKETRAIDARAGMSQQEKDLLKAEIILNFMHERVLVQYRLEDTTFTNLLERGFYNCVTASTLYCALAESAGLQVTAVELPGHAMCWVYLPNNERLEVETTCCSWFKYKNDPQTQKKVICDLIRAASPQLKDQSDQMLLLQIPQPISDKRLIAKIYYNRGVDLLSANDFSGALEANAMAYCLDPQSETTQGNLLATMNNWAIALCKDQKYELAANLLRTGISHAPTYPPFKNNHTHVYHLWVDSLYRSGKLQNALQIAKQAEIEQPDVPHFQRLQRQINETIASLPSDTVRR